VVPEPARVGCCKRCGGLHLGSGCTVAWGPPQLYGRQQALFELALKQKRVAVASTW
jgi:hypothetical protein